MIEMPSQVDEYVIFAANFFECGVAPVKPIGDMYAGFVNAMCHTLLDEFNMAWVAMGFALLFSIPMMFSASLLESVFRRGKDDEAAKFKWN